MTKGLSNRAKNLKRRQQREKKAAYQTWLPKRHTVKGAAYATFLDLPRELRDQIYEPLLTLPADCDCLRLSTDPSPKVQRQLRLQEPTLDEFFRLSLVSRKLSREVENVLFTNNEVCIYVDSFEQPGDWKLATGFPEFHNMPTECELLPGLTDATIPRLPKVTVQDTIFWKTGSTSWKAGAICATTLMWEKASGDNMWLKCFPTEEIQSWRKMTVREYGDVREAEFREMAERVMEMTIGKAGSWELSMNRLQEIVLMQRKLGGLKALESMRRWRPVMFCEICRERSELEFGGCEGLEASERVREGGTCDGSTCKGDSVITS